MMLRIIEAGQVMLAPLWLGENVKHDGRLRSASTGIARTV